MIHIFATLLLYCRCQDNAVNSKGSLPQPRSFFHQTTFTSSPKSHNVTCDHLYASPQEPCLAAILDEQNHFYPQYGSTPWVTPPV